MYVCIYIYSYIYIHTYVYTYMRYVYVYVYMYVYVYVYVHVSVSVSVYVYVSMHSMHKTSVYVCERAKDASIRAGSRNPNSNLLRSNATSHEVFSWFERYQ